MKLSSSILPLLLAPVFIVKTNLIYLPGPYSLTKEEVQLLANDLPAIYKPLHVRLKIKIKEVNTYEPNYPITSNSLGYLMSFFDSNLYQKRLPGANLLVTPPFILHTPSYSKIYIAGVSLLNSYPKGFGFLAAMFENQDGVNRYNSALYGAAHELGHELGAYHDPVDSCYVMDTDVAFCAAKLGSLEWSVKSKREIRARLGSLRRKHGY